MANVDVLKEKGLAIIDSAQTILKDFPRFKETSSDMSLSLLRFSTDPLSYLVDIFKHTEGYDALLDTIAKYLVYGIEPLEVAVKTVIIAHIRDFFSCSTNPFITDELLLEGITFNLNSLDLTNMLEVCPLDESIGKYFYFGINDEDPNNKIDIPDELNQARDLNALLWYMRNRSIGRTVWYGSEKQHNVNNVDIPTGNEKLKKKDGIITLEYNENFQEMLNAEGNACFFQVPRHDSIHVFIGNAAPTTPSDTLTKRLANINTQITTKDDEITELEDEFYANEDNLLTLEEKINSIADSEIIEDYQQEYKKYKDEKERLSSLIKIAENELNNLVLEKNKIEQEYATAISSLETNAYRKITQNHYYRAPLMQFNADLVASMDLFDSKVIAAQILENLTGEISVDLRLNYSRKIIQDEVIKMVKNVIESDDTVVSDCFFSFSNEDYDEMLKQTELIRAGVYSKGSSLLGDKKIDAKSLLDSLNNLSDDATEEERISVYKNMFDTFSKEVCVVQEGQGEKFKLGLRLRILEELLTQLVVAICLSIISPKLYMLIAINLKIMGQSVDFNLKDFIQMYRQLLVQLIRTVRDMILQFFIDFIKDKLIELARLLGIELAKEALMAYIDLLMRCINCFRFNINGKQNDWELGTVTADIEQDESESPKNAEC